MWCLWGLALFTSICRAVLRLKVQGKYLPEDYFACTSFIFLTALTSTITVAAPTSFMGRDYLVAAVKDSHTPPPLPLDQMNDRIVWSMKVMFA